MSKTILEVGKELMSKSLNSYRRKTGITQLEENNKMQDGILNGILSQVDDAYVEKTEQSNVIHLEGSGDGVVVLDSIEGNTMVNLIDVDNTHGTYIMENTKNTGIIYGKTTILKPNTTYTIMYYIKGTTEVNVTSVASMFRLDSYNQDGSVINGYFHGFTGKLTTNYQFVKSKFETPNNIGFINLHVRNAYHDYALESNTLTVKDVIILEGDWTNKETPSHFIGLQSSFEEKVNDEGKYEIEILIKNKNLFDGEMEDGAYGASGVEITHPTFRNKNKFILVEPNTKYNLQCINSGEKPVIHEYDENKTFIRYGYDISRYGTHERTKYINFRTQTNTLDYKFQLEKGDVLSEYIPHKTNKIKLLINEPLRSTPLGNDRLCVVDGKLMIERKNKQIIINGEERYKQSNLGEVVDCAYFEILDIMDAKKRTQNGEVYCDRLPSLGEVNKYQDKENIFCDSNYNLIGIKISRSKLTTHDIDGIKTYFRNNNTKLCYPLKESIYEEVLNEYGEPIILEGYENGTLYIDSTVLPTTTVRYTPKMESFKTLKEVNKNNNSITLDINENIIPYMMDVDYMIMEKELCLLNTKNIRKMEELDMTSMQKRTQDMLERLIKGKTLTEQECKTRVTTYLHAGKITDEQAEELMLLIDEVYA